MSLGSHVSASGQPVLRVQNVFKSFGGSAALSDVSLDVAQGEVVVVVGASGSGKSTLCRCANRLETIDSGSIAIDGVPLPAEGRALARLRADVGMVFQSFNLFAHKTVLENVTLGPVRVRRQSKTEAEKQARAFLDRVGVGHKEAAYPAELSGGQQQRVAIARALAMQPRLTVDAVFATYTITPARAQKVAFAGPYYESGDAIMVKADNTSITKVEDLNNKTVATESNSTAALAIKKFAPSANVLLFTEDAQCVAAVQQGRADAYVLDQGILISDASTNKAVKVVGQPFTQEPYGIGLPNDDTQAKTFVNDWLRKVYDDGSWAKLWRATIGTVVSGDPPTPPAIGSVPGS